MYVHLNLHRDCFFSADAKNIKFKFLVQINQSFGSGGMTSGLDASQLIEYFQYLQRSIGEQLPSKRQLCAVVCSLMAHV